MQLVGCILPFFCNWMLPRLHAHTAVRNHSHGDYAIGLDVPSPTVQLDRLTNPIDLLPSSSHSRRVETADMQAYRQGSFDYLCCYVLLCRYPYQS